MTQKKFKTIHDWVGEVIDSELCKRFKFVHITKLLGSNIITPYKQMIYAQTRIYPRKKKLVSFSGTLRYKQITHSPLEDLSQF